MTTRLSVNFFFLIFLSIANYLEFSIPTPCWQQGCQVYKQLIINRLDNLVKRSIGQKCTHLKQRLIDIEHFQEDLLRKGHKKRLSLVSTEPKGQKLKISELMYN